MKDFRPTEVLRNPSEVEEYARSVLGYSKRFWRDKLRKLAPQPPTFKVALDSWYRDRRSYAKRGVTRRQSEALSLRRSGLKIREIQRKMGITKDAVMRLLRRARKNESEQVQRAVRRRYM